MRDLESKRDMRTKVLVGVGIIAAIVIYKFLTLASKEETKISPSKKRDISNP